MAIPRATWIEVGVPGLAALVGLGIVGLWIGSYFAPVAVEPRPLGNEARPRASAKAPAPAAAGPGGEVPASSVPAPAQTASVVSAPAGAPVANLPGDWPGFRGPNRDNIARDAAPFAGDLKAVKALWTVPMGEGYAAPAVKNGRVYVLDYDAQGRQDVLRCLSLADGSEIWRNAYPADVKRNHGMSRTIPATDGKVVVSLGPKCQVLAADAVTGKTLWTLDLVKDFGATVPEWYAGQCPLIDQGRVVLAVGGDDLAIAADLATGKVVWRTPNPRKWLMTHASVAKMDHGGEAGYVLCGSGGVAGVSAKDGRLLWDSPEWVVSTATVPTPLPVGDGRVFLSGGYNAGAMMLKVEKSGSGFVAKSLWKVSSDVFGSDQQTPVLLDGRIYGVVPGGEAVCLGLDGKRVWASGSEGRFGLGPYLVADGKLLLMNDGGTLTAATATPEGFRPLGKVRLLGGRESWGPMAIAGDRLLARDAETLICVSLK